MPLPESRNVLPLEGEIDLHAVPAISAILNRLIQEKPSRIIVDLSLVTYIDSSGLALLVEAMKNVEDYGGRFALAGVGENVRPIFETARLDQVFLSFPHVDAALSAV